MSKFQNFSTVKPTEAGWYWTNNITVMDDPEIVLVRPIDPDDPSSELGFQRMGSANIRPLTGAAVDLMQWQKAEWL